MRRCSSRRKERERDLRRPRPADERLMAAAVRLEPAAVHAGDPAAALDAPTRQVQLRLRKGLAYGRSASALDRPATRCELGQVAVRGNAVTRLPDPGAQQIRVVTG